MKEASTSQVPQSVRRGHSPESGTDAVGSTTGSYGAQERDTQRTTATDKCFILGVEIPCYADAKKPQH